MTRAIVFVTKGFEDIEALVPFDILIRANIETKLISLDDGLEVQGKYGVKVIADELFSEDLTADILVLPGGAVLGKYFEHQGLQKLIELQQAKNGWIAAICSAPALLGHMGILDNKVAVSYPSPDVRKHLDKAIIVEDKVVVSNNIITAKAAANSLDFALQIIHEIDRVVAKQVKDAIYY